MVFSHPVGLQPSDQKVDFDIPIILTHHVANQPRRYAEAIRDREIAFEGEANFEVILAHVGS